MTERIITSTQNPRVKHLVALQQKSSLRRSEGLFVVEGRRELRHCTEAGFEIEELFVAAGSSISCTSEGDMQLGLSEHAACFSVTPQVYEKMAYRGGTEGIIATVKTRQQSLSDLRLGHAPLLMVLESVEKPGNLGAMLRSADAAHADAVIVCDPLTDLYNPNLIRASLGAVFSVPCIACSSEECIGFLKRQGIRILTAQLQDSHLYYHTDMRQGTALVMGTESTGLTDSWRQAADAHIRIPMLGRLDSLNVSVSAAILLFEAVRQRNETHNQQQLTDR